MHRRISTTLNTLRQDLAAKLGCDFIHHACRQAGHSWCDSCLLTPAAIIHWFLIQVLHGNTALTHVSLLAGRAFTASTFCQALRPAPVGRLPDRPPRGGQDPGPCHRGRGTLVRPSRLAHRRLVVLHARCRRAASLLRPAGQPGQGCGFPVAHILALFHAGTGLLLEVFAAPLRSHDMAGVGGILPLLKRGDVLVADRGFCSFAHLAADLQGRPCGISPAPEADRRLHAGPCPCPARSEAGTQGDAAQPLGVGLRPDGSSGRIFQAGAVPRVDERGRVPEVARVDHGA